MENENIVDLIQAGTGNQKELYSMLWDNMRGLIAAIARKYSGQDDFEDSMQQGFLGLYAAVQNYDPAAGVPFFSYAPIWIRASINRYKNENTAVVRLPSHIAAKKNQYKRFLARYQMDHGADPDDGTICSVLDLTPADLDRIRAALAAESACSISSPVPGTDDLTIEDTISDTADLIGDAESQMMNEQLSGVIWPLVDALEPEQAEVLKGRFLEDLTRPEIDSMHGWRAGRSADLEYKALQKLKHGKARRVLLPFLPEQVAAEAFRGSSVQKFESTWTSSTERAAFKLAEM